MQVKQACELSIVIPCLNEAETLPVCIRKAQSFLSGEQIDGEVLVADNGSTDGSQDIARGLSARVVPVKEKGYGSALMGGIKAARGTYVIMGDGDDSYDFSALHDFVFNLRAGYELVMGNRFKGGILPGAMPWPNKYIGNPLLSGIGRLFFGGPCRDFHCGLRGFSKQAILDLNLQTTGMEFASEMVVKALLHKLKVTEVPIHLHPDGRSRPPHLRRWRDGWRHLRFLLMYSPQWLFLYPGLAALILGLVVMLVLIPGTISVGRITIDIHTMLYAAMAIILGLQIVFFAVFSKTYAMRIGLVPEDPLIKRFMRFFNLEYSLLAGLVVFLLGLAGSIYSVALWGSRSFGTLIPESMMRIVIPSATFVVVGIQILFASFFISILTLKYKR